MSHSNALAADTTLEEYQIHSVLGTGGFGITYKAWDANLESWVAIKEYFPTEWSYRDHDGITVRANTQGMQSVADPGLADYEWGLDRFLDEARVLARVKSPYVVRINRYFRANGSAYIVMDYEDGEPLSALLRRRGNLDEADLRGMLKEVLPALQAVHEQGFLHRDIKPGNLYVRADGCVILIDFGAARQSLGRQSKSVTGLVTPGYSPPEQYALRSDRYGTWTDIYALGAVLYRCISGQPPLESAERLIEDSLIPATEVGAGRYSEAMLQVLDKALAVRPEHRYQSVEAMQVDLGDLFVDTVARQEAPAPAANPTVMAPPQAVDSQTQTVAEQPPQVLSSAPSPTHQERPLRRLPLALAVVAAVVMITGVWWRLSGPDNTVVDTGNDIAPIAPPVAVVEQPAETTPVASPPPRDPAYLGLIQYLRNHFLDGFSDDQHFWREKLLSANPGGIGLTPANEQQRQIEELLRLAAERLSSNSLSVPVEDNAVYYFQQVLSISPNNPLARQGLAAIVERYIGLAERELNQGDRAGARRMVSRGLNLSPSDSRLLALQQQARTQPRASQPTSVRIQQPSPFRPQPSITQDDLLNRDSR